MKKHAVKTWSTPVTDEKKRIIPCVLCGASHFKRALQCDGFAYVRCASCNMVQMNPQPEVDPVLRRYTKIYGEEYRAYELANEDSFLHLQLLALKDAGFDMCEQEIFQRSTGTAPLVLDVGCASGALLYELKKRGWQVCGVEISPAAEYARNTRLLDVRSLPLEQNCFASESFDLIHASHLLEHLNQPALFIRETFRLLRKGGRLFVTTPNIAGFQARLFGGSWRSAIFDHLCLFSVKTLSALIVHAGFHIECVRTWGGLAAGTVPLWLKKIADSTAKKLGQGDVMIICAVKP